MNEVWDNQNTFEARKNFLCGTKTGNEAWNTRGKCEFCTEGVDCHTKRRNCVHCGHNPLEKRKRIIEIKDALQSTTIERQPCWTYSFG